MKIISCNNLFFAHNILLKRRFVSVKRRFILPLCFFIYLSFYFIPLKALTQENFFDITTADTFDKYNNQHLGLFIPDFKIVTEDSADTLSVYNFTADSIIILFYDPDCGHCKKEIKRLRKNKKLNRQISSNKTVVLTVAPDISFDYWQQTVKTMPKNWNNAYCTDNDLIIRKLLWKVPEKFTLDKNKRITHIDMYRKDYD